MFIIGFENVIVIIKYYFIVIMGFDEIFGQMDIVGYMKVNWNIEFLMWNFIDIFGIILLQDNFWFLFLVVVNFVILFFEVGYFSYLV